MGSMLRLTLLTAASVAVRVVDVEHLLSKQSLPLSESRIATLVWALKWGLPLCAIINVNSTLNRWAENRWRWASDKSQWSWKDEVAVVTGGSAGIGACVVQKLVSHDIKVAVLDVGPLSESFTKGVGINHAS